MVGHRGNPGAVQIPEAGAGWGHQHPHGWPSWDGHHPGPSKGPERLLLGEPGPGAVPPAVPFWVKALCHLTAIQQPQSLQGSFFLKKKSK